MIKKNIHLGDEPALCKLYVNRYHIVFASDVRSKIIETGGKGKMKKAEKITIKVLKRELGLHIILLSLIHI